MQASPDKMVRDIRVVVEDAENLIKATAGDIEDKTREARAKLAGALVVLKESLNKGEQRATDGVRAAGALVRRYPFQSLGAAFVAGLVLGIVAFRR